MLRDKAFLFLLFSGFFVAVFEILALSGLHLPVFVAFPFFLAIILLIGHETIYQGLKALIRFNFSNIKLLMVIAAAGAFYLGQFEEAAVVIVLYTLAEKMEDIGIAKSRSSFDALIDRMPKEADVVGKGLIQVMDIVIGDVIQLKPGAMIPLDGEIVKGMTTVDEATITGEPIPQDKAQGEAVFAGTLNLQGYIEILVQKQWDQTAIAKISELTFEAVRTKAKTQKFIEKFARIYTPLVIGLALGVFTVPVFILGLNVDFWLLEALTLLVISCPCALVISTPVAVYSAIGCASGKGALIKGGRYLEILGKLKAIAFDKTKTLTIGKPVVTDVIACGAHTEESLLSCAGGMELLSEHPLSDSIVAHALQRGMELHAVKNFQTVVGKGAKADCLVCTASHHCIGKLQFVLEEHDVPQGIVDKVEMLQQEGKTVVVMCSKEEVMGLIALSDKEREVSLQLIDDLKKENVRSIMLTGDHPTVAKVIAERLGIEEVHAGLLPQEKGDHMRLLLEKYGEVAMVGDGINDALALAISSVGITLDSLGSDMAIEAASVVLLSDRISLIPKLIRLGKRTLSIIRFNTFWAIFVKVLFITLAIFGMSNLAMAIFADVGVTVLVIGNSLRLLRG